MANSRTFNLLREKWIPVRRRSGAVEWIAPHEITQGDRGDGASPEDDPYVALAAPRPDFDGALIQFLIGLVQTRFAPPGEDEWWDRLFSPPSAEELREAFAPVEEAFWLDGDGPRFMQDLTVEADLKAKMIEKAQKAAAKKSSKASAKVAPDAEAESDDEDEEGEKDIDNLFLNSAGGGAVKENRDLFIKRNGILGPTALGISPAAAAMALIALQNSVPGKCCIGVSNMSLRGGGPLTTLVLGKTLWETVWRNVLPRGEFLQQGKGVPFEEFPPLDARRFPWLAPTRSSLNKSDKTTSLIHHGHPDQHYWSMPSRVRLLFAEGDPQARCPLTGLAMPYRVPGFLTLEGGPHYQNGGWIHPLSPHRQKAGELPKALETPKRGIVFREWMGLVLGTRGDKKRPDFLPAAVVAAATQRMQSEADLRLWTFGWELKQAKVFAWHDATLPLIVLPEPKDEAARDRFDEKRVAFTTEIERAIEGAKHCVNKLVWHIKTAESKNPKEYRGDLSHLDRRLYEETREAFFKLIQTLRDSWRDRGETAPSEVWKDWGETLRKATIALFDERCPMDGDGQTDPEKVVKARVGLLQDLRLEPWEPPAPAPAESSDAAKKGKGGKKPAKAPKPPVNKNPNLADVLGLPRSAPAPSSLQP